MKKILFIAILLSAISSINAQINEIKVGKNGITFQDGEVMSTSFAPSSAIPGGGQVARLVAEFSNGIIGDSPLSDWENHVELLALDSYLFRPIDNRGNPGNLLHRNFVISKPVDVATVDILSFYNNGQPIHSIEIKMIAPDPIQGMLVEIFTITLNDVVIVEYRMDLDFDPNTDSFYFTEKFHLQYQSIDLNHIASGNVLNIPWRY